MVILSINTTNNKKTIIGLSFDGKEDVLEKEVETRSSQETLSLINEILKKHNLSIKDITEIQVHAGPGSFTGTRVGVAVANALGFALGLPVNGAKIIEGKTLVEPQY